MTVKIDESFITMMKARHGAALRGCNRLSNRSRGSVGDAHQVTGPATSGVA